MRHDKTDSQLYAGTVEVEFRAVHLKTGTQQPVLVRGEQT